MADDVWMLKHPTRPGGVASPIPYCGYDKDELESIMDAGYVLTKNGEEVPLPAQKKEEDADVKEAPKRRPRK